ncbi:uncharacterized protein LOC134540419 isoform X3 [Bacillus rossius redtenbacheri]|uniref:uncharacterized protein LOC134540419 isoform X3 n=1 Tax=Bacillus rossius redtenbacheri TaxID=93214 RepID=UPI002FDE38A0
MNKSSDYTDYLLYGHSGFVHGSYSSTETVTYRYQKWTTFSGQTTLNALHAFICEVHFDASQFTDEHKLFLIRGAVPTLSPPNESALTSVERFEEVEDVPHPSLGPEGFFCCVKGCPNSGSKKSPGVTFHKFPSAAARAREWVRIVREINLRSDERDRPLSRNSVICSNHFRWRDFNRTEPSRPCVKEGAVPSLFPPVPEYLKSKHTIIRKIPIRRVSEGEGQDGRTNSEDLSGSSMASVTSQDGSRRRPCISEVEGHVYKVARSSEEGDDSDDSSHQYEIVTMDAVEAASRQSESPGPSPPKRKRGRPRARVQTVVPPTSEILYNVLVKTDIFRSTLPPNWHRLVHVAGANGCVIFACYESQRREGCLPACVREVLVDRACRAHCFVGGLRLEPRAFAIDDDVATLEDVVRLVAAVDGLRLCRGAFRAGEVAGGVVPGARLDPDLAWRADDCPQILQACRTCEACCRTRKALLHEVRRARQEALEEEGDGSYASQHFLLDADQAGESADLQQ